MNDQRKTKKQLLEDLERERQRSIALQEVSNKVAAAHDTDEVLDLIVIEAERLVGATGAFIRLLAGEGLVASAATEGAAALLAIGAKEMPAIQVEEGTSFVGHAMATKKPLISQDVQEDELATATGRDMAKKYGFHGTAVVPLLANDRSIGVLVVIDKQIRRFTEDEVSLLSAFADQASLALEKARLLNEAETERERADSLYRISNQLAGAHDTEEVLDLIMNEAGRLIGTEYVVMRLLEGDALVSRASTEPMKPFLARLAATIPHLKVEEGGYIPGHVLATKKPVYGEEFERRVSPEALRIGQEEGFQAGSTIVVPLLANGQPIGVITVFDTRIRQIKEDEVTLLAAFADQAALALEKARLLNEAETERERSDALYRVSNLLAGAHETQEVLDLIVNEAARLVATPAAIIRILEGDVLVTGAATKAAAEYAAASARLNPGLPVGQGSALGRLLDGKKPSTNPDVSQNEKLTPEARALLQKYGVHGLVGIPLVANDRPIGTLTLWDQQIRQFTDDEVSLLSAFADQAALALDKARLLNEAETEKGRAETEKERSDALYRVSNLLAGAHDTDVVLDLIVNEAARLLRASAAVLRLLRGDVLVPGASTESAAGLIARSVDAQPAVPVGEGSGLVGHVMATKKPLVSSDVTKDESLPELTVSIAGEFGFHGLAAVPLLANDNSIGVLVVMDSQPRFFSEDEVSLLAAFADQAALALEKARLLNEAEARERQATQLYEVTTQLASNQNLNSVLDLIAASACDLFECEASSIFEYDAVKNGLSAARTHNFPPEMIESLFFRPGEGTPGKSFQQREPVWTKDRLSDPSYVSPDSDSESAVRFAGVRGAASVPIIIRGQPYGVLNILFFETHEFTDGEIQLLQTLADSAAVAINNARFIEEIQHQTAEVAATNQELEAFSYSVSHDLRAPLRGIDGFSQALMNEYSDVLDEQAKHYLERVRTGSERMGQLIDDLLALSQVTRGEMRRENVDLSDLARTIVTGLQERDPERQVEFVIQDGVVLNGDTRLLRVALENLLGNAYKYTGKKEEARIEFGLTEDDGKRTCFVRDDGSGFDMAYADRLFGAFQRLHDASEFEGSGIGLATVQRIINRHGGRIWAESAVGEGATFYFTLS